MTECVLTSHTAESVKNLIFIAGIVYLIVHVIAYFMDRVMPKAVKFFKDCNRALEDADKQISEHETAIRDGEECMFLLVRRMDIMEAKMEALTPAADRRASLRPRRQ